MQYKHFRELGLGILVGYVRATCKRHCFDAFPRIGHLSIDTDGLIEQAEEIELEMQKLAETVRETVEPDEPPKPLPMHG